MRHHVVRDQAVNCGEGRFSALAERSGESGQMVADEAIVPLSEHDKPRRAGSVQLFCGFGDVGVHEARALVVMITGKSRARNLDSDERVPPRIDRRFLINSKIADSWSSRPRVRLHLELTTRLQRS